MASCNNCGRDVSPEARVCSHCGQPKPAEAVTSSSEQEEEFTGLFLLAFVAAPLASAAAFGVLWVLLLFVGSAKQILGFGVANINYETLKLLSLSGAGLIFLVLEFFAFKSLVDHPMAIFKFSAV